MSSTRWRPGRPAVVWICLTVTLIVLGGAIYAGWGAILERWYVYRLDSPDLEVRKHAIDKLGEKGSNKACLRLLEIARKDDVLGPRVVAALVRGRDRASPELLSLLEERRGEGFFLRSIVAIEQGGASPAATSALLAIALHGEGPARPPFHEARVLERTGAGPVPELIQALESGDRVVRERAFQLLRAPVAPRAVPVLCSLLESEECWPGRLRGPGCHPGALVDPHKVTAHTRMCAAPT